MQFVGFHVLHVNINVQKTVGGRIAFQLDGFQIAVGDVKHRIVQRQARHRGSIAVGSTVFVQRGNKRALAVPVLGGLVFVPINVKTQSGVLNSNFFGIDDVVVHRHILCRGSGFGINGIVTFKDIAATFDIVVDYPGAAAGSVKSNG